MFNRELKERVKLLEIETHKMLMIINELTKDKKLAIRPCLRDTNTYLGAELSYEDLRKKYRSFTPDYNDGL